MSRSRALDLNQLAMERAETVAARAVAAAYNQARRELLATLLEQWVGPGTLTPQAARELALRLGLLEQIDARLRQLEQETGVILRGVLVDAEERALESVRREMAVLPRTITEGLAPFTRINTAMVERFLPVALDEAQLATGALRLVLRREIQVGLAQGEAFPHLVGRLLRANAPGEGTAVFRNGAASAERAARRMVIQAENAAKQEFIGQVKRQVPEVRKQAVAVISGNTTDCCLRVHGQIVDVDQPFELTGTPRFADRLMHSPFHWGCRTAITMWHPRFESGGLTTANMTTSAQAELRKRST